MVNQWLLIVFSARSNQFATKLRQKICCRKAVFFLWWIANNIFVIIKIYTFIITITQILFYFRIYNSISFVYSANTIQIYFWSLIMKDRNLYEIYPLFDYDSSNALNVGCANCCIHRNIDGMIYCVYWLYTVSNISLVIYKVMRNILSICIKYFIIVNWYIQ